MALATVASAGIDSQMDSDRSPIPHRSALRVMRRMNTLTRMQHANTDAMKVHAAIHIQSTFRKKKDWSEVRNLHKSTLSLTRARCRLRGRRLAKQDFQEVSDGEYWQQGDHAMHTRDMWEKRMLLRKHPLVTAVLKRWCGVLRTPVSLADYIGVRARGSIRSHPPTLLLTCTLPCDAAECAHLQGAERARHG